MCELLDLSLTILALAAQSGHFSTTPQECASTGRNVRHYAHAEASGRYDNISEASSMVQHEP
jgi:hypothetical protein